MKRRLLSFALILCLLMSLLPASAFAAWDWENEAYSITLPIADEAGAESGEYKPTGNGMTASAFGLIANQPTYEYLYAGTDDTYISTSFDIIIAEGQAEPGSSSTSSGSLTLHDEDGKLAATATRVWWSYRTKDGVKSYYVSSAGFEDLSGLAEGMYTLKLAVDDQSYDLNGCVVVLGRDCLLLDSVSFTGFYSGCAEFDLEMTVYGFEKEAELDKLSFEVQAASETGYTTVAKTTGAYREIRENQNDGSWRLYSQIKVLDGFAIESGTSYCLKISYSGDKDLYDGVGAVTRNAYTPSIEIADFEILDPLTGQVQVTLKHHESYIDAEDNETYKVVVADGNSLDTANIYASTEVGELREDGTYVFDMRLNGQVVPLNSYGNYFYAVVYRYSSYSWGGSYEGNVTSTQFDNPYANIQDSTGNYNFYPWYVEADATSVDFYITYSNDSVFKGSGDVVTLRDYNDEVVATCDKLTRTMTNNYSGRISGSFSVPGGFDLGESNSEEYIVYLNGVEVGDISVSKKLRTSTYIPLRDYSANTFHMALGIFPVHTTAINTSGSGYFYFADENGSVAVKGKNVAGKASERHPGMLDYTYEFTAAELSALTNGAVYTLKFCDASGAEVRLMTDYAYNSEKADMDLGQAEWGAYWYKAGLGASSVEANFSFENWSGLTADELEAEVKKLSLSNGSDTFTVTGYKNPYWNYNSYYADLTLSAPLTAGKYTVYYDGSQIDSFTVSAPEETDEPPHIGSYINEGDNYIHGYNLPADSVYTARIYNGYTCMTENAFTLTYTVFEDGDSIYLYFDRSVLEGLEPGKYEIRVSMDGTYLGFAYVEVPEETIPIIVLNDEDEDWNDSGDSVINVSSVMYEIANIGNYRYIRVAESKEALAGAEFEEYRSNYYNGYTFADETTEGPRALYMELSVTGEADDEDNLFYDFKLWLCLDGDYDLRVPESIQGIQNPKDDSYTITATVEYPSARVNVAFYDGDGNHATTQMAYSGQTADGRYEFKLSFDLNDYLYDYNYYSVKGEHFRYLNSQSISVFVTDMSTEYHDGENYLGTVMGEPVERVLIFGDPSYVILPQFRDGYADVNKAEFDLYGYATPGSTVTVYDGSEEELGTATANDYGYFTLKLTGLGEGSNYISASDSLGLESSGWNYINVDTVAPAIDSLGFTFNDDGINAIIRWVCTAGDVDYFEIYKNGVFLREVGSDVTNANVVASPDDGSIFTLKAYDYAGNVSEKTVSTADSEPPTAPGSLGVTAATTTTLSLSWTAGTDNIGVAGYQIFVGGELAGETSGTAYTLTGLEQGGEYAVSVKTRDKAGLLSEAAGITASTVGLSISSDMESAYMVDLYPGKTIPVNVSVTASEEAYSLSLSRVWLEFRAADSTDKWTEQTLAVSGSGSWNISGSDTDGYLPKGAYELYFHAVDSEGAEVVSEPVTVVVLSVDDVPPGAPGAPSAVSHSTTGITFNWTGASDNVAVDHYIILRDGDELATTKETSYTDTGLAMGTAYKYSVKAVDARGNVSEPASAMLSTMKLEFDSVSGLAESYVVEETPSGAAVWARFKAEGDVLPELSMDMQYKLGDGEWVSVPLASAGDAALFEGIWYLEDGEGYLPLGSYTVRFHMSDGAADAYSEEQTVVLEGEKTAPVIDRLSAGSGTVSGKCVTISLSAGDNVGVSYAELSWSADGESFTLITEKENTPGYLMVSYDWDASGLPSGSYTIKAVVRDVRGNSAEETASVTIDNTPPAVPTGLTVTASSRFIKVMWDTDYELSDDFSHFNVYRAAGADGGYTCVTSTSGVGYYDDGESAEAGVTYYYYVTAVDRLGNESAATEACSATMIADNESPEISDMSPAEGASLRRQTSLQVLAADNYRLSKAVFYYRAVGSSEWIKLGEDAADSVTNGCVFSLAWTIPSGITEGEYEIKAEVFDESISGVELGYPANAPAVKTVTVTVYDYSAPVAPELSASAGYKTALLSWTYSGDLDTLRHFVVYKTAGDGSGREYIAGVKGGADGSYTAEIPANGVNYFVVEAVDCYGVTAASQPVSVTSAPKEEEPPVALLQPETLTAAAGVPFSFSGVNSTDNDVIVSYKWSFGDGGTGEGSEYRYTYTEAGTYTVTLTVTDESGNSDSDTKTMTVYDVAGDEATHALMTITAVNAYEASTPVIPGADVKIYIENADGGIAFETSGKTDENGVVTAVVPIGDVTVSAAADGFIATSRAVAVTPDESGAFAYTLGMTPMNVSLVDGSLSVTEMTYDEIRAAGIDVNDPDNNHVWKFAAELEFTAGPAFPFDLPTIPVIGYFNGAGAFLGGSGWGWGGGSLSDDSSGGGGWGGLRIGVFPISENFILVIYGEAHWLKEMYNVELIVINNSYVDDITDCEATLSLPDGLSLAAMTGKVQNETISIGTIHHKDSTSEESENNTTKATWYVRGDKEGEYNLTATVTGRNPEPFVKTFTTDKPVKVYAGSALKLYITADDIAYREEEYHVQFKLQNVSDKELYNLSFGITGAEQFRVVRIGDEETRTELTQEDFGNGMTESVKVLKPGESITIDFYTTVWFSSILEFVDLGPFDVGYYLTNVFVTTLEGSTTTIPYEVNITHVSHGSLLDYVLDSAKDDLVGTVADVIDDTVFFGAPVASGTLDILEFKSKAETGDPASKAEITVENGYFTSSGNTVSRFGLRDNAIAVYTDAAEGSYELRADGRTMTITGDAKIYVRAEAAGEGKITVTTYTSYGEDNIRKNVYTGTYTVDGEAGPAEQVVLQAPEGAENGVDVPLAGEFAEVTFPYVMVDADGNYVTTASNAQWSISGKDSEGNDLTETELAALSIADGVLLFGSDARGGIYTVTLSAGEHSASQTIVLNKEAPVATVLELCRDGGPVSAADTLVLPVTGDGEQHVYTAKLYDQYGAEMDEEIVWNAVDNGTNAVIEGGSITLGRDNGTGSIKLTASAAGLSVSVEITVTNLMVDWSGVEAALQGTLYTYGDANGKASLPASGTATALETVKGTFSYADADSIQSAGEGAVTVVFTVNEDEGDYAGAAISRDFPISIAKKELTDAMLNVSGSYSYTGSAIVPEYTVADGELMSGSDYTIAFSDNVNAGAAAVTVTASEDGNYTGTASGSFVIAKADITGFVSDAPSHSVLANDAANTGTAALKAVANGGSALPGQVTVSFGPGLTASLPIAWADSADTFNVKGGSYSYTGSVDAGENFNAYSGKLTAVVTVTPVTGTLVSEVPAAVTIAKAKAQAAESYADFKLPASVELAFDNGVANRSYTELTWSVSLDKLKNSAVGSTTKVTLGSLPQWITISDIAVDITITDKYPVNVSVTAPPDVTYGELPGEPAAQQTAVDDGIDAEAEWTYLYEGSTASGETYSSSEKPTQAGSYTVTATLVSDTHAGSGKSAQFNILPKALNADMITISGSYSYTGSAVVPEYTVADGGLLTASDYSAELSNNINAGEASVTLTGKNNYTGTVSKSFDIAPASISELVPTIAGKLSAGNAISGKLDVAGFAGGDFVWSWQRDGQPVGSGEQVYILTGEDSGCSITLTVTAKENTNYTGSTQPSAAAAVEKMEVTGSVVIAESSNGGAANTIDAGDVLSADTSGIMPETAREGGSFQWYRDGEAIEGATGSSYTVTAEDEGASITVTYTPAEKFTGEASAEIETGKTVITGELDVSGEAELDGVLSADFRTELTEGYELVWLRDGEVIEGAEGSSYTISKEDQGKTISVKAVARDGCTGEVLGGSVAVPAAAPDQPELTASAGNKKVTLRWTAPADNGAPITGYTLKMDGEVVARLAADETSFVVSGLDNRTAYSFTLTAHNSEGSAESAAVSATPKSSGGGSSSGDSGSGSSGGSSGGGEPDDDKKEETVSVGSVFADVAGHWGLEAIQYVYDKGLVNGVADDRFAPNATLNRAMLVTILYRMEGEPRVSGGSVFADVASGQWYSDAVAWAAANGIVEGVSDTEFAPMANITREQMATMLMRYSNYKRYSMARNGDISGYADAGKVSAWALAAVEWANAEGLINGRTETTIVPDGTATRAEAATILMRFLENVAK